MKFLAAIHSKVTSMAPHHGLNAVTSNFLAIFLSFTCAPILASLLLVLSLAVLSGHNLNQAVLLKLCTSLLYMTEHQSAIVYVLQYIICILLTV
jgi:hypothetical protein